MMKKEKHGQNTIQCPDTLSSSDNKNNKGCKNPSRRIFIQKAIAGSIAVASTAGLAKIVVSAAAQHMPMPKTASFNDNLKQDRLMGQKKYVVMTQEEKEQMVQTLVNNYKKQSL